ncbi:MAG: DJ-1 family glyoxalase III [Muribaculaceae bacterium]
MAKTSYVFLAEGFEEVEALAQVDLLRRAGLEVRTVSITDSHKVAGSHGIPVEADLTFKQADFDQAEFLILPGGLPGSTNLAAFAPLNDLLRVHAMNHGHIAAICAAPAVVLAPLGLLRGRKATCYPGFDNALIDNGAEYHTDRVVRDGNIITGNGPSSAFYFGLAIIEAIAGKDKAEEVASGLLIFPGSMPYYLA